MVSPAFLRACVFPWYRKVGDLCPPENPVPLPFGRQLLAGDPGLIEAGINAHSSA